MSPQRACLIAMTEERNYSVFVVNSVTVSGQPVSVTTVDAGVTSNTGDLRLSLYKHNHSLQHLNVFITRSGC